MNDIEFSLDDFCSLFCDDQYQLKYIDKTENFKQENDAEDYPTPHNSQDNQSDVQLQQQTEKQQFSYYTYSQDEFMSSGFWGENSDGSQHSNNNKTEIYTDQQQDQQRVKKQKNSNQKESKDDHETTGQKSNHDIYVNRKINIQKDRRWDMKTTRQFEIVISCLGISNCKVEDYEQFVDLNYSREKQMTHLQKYKRKLMTQYSLKDKKQLKNYMYLKTSKNANILKRICCQWKNPNFQGYTRDEILGFLNKN